ncbi:MAG: hypothetical protein HKL89_08380 [Candidatus Dormibacteraeota bacterium]|nr:hypothetical protein [Candidatus Dormibacteraeota bacterium]
MDLVPEAVPGAIMGESAQNLGPTSLGDEVIALDTSNLYTWTDSGNSRPPMPRRGHNKAHR